MKLLSVFALVAIAATQASASRGPDLYLSDVLGASPERIGISQPVVPTPVSVPYAACPIPKVEQTMQVACADS